MPATSDHTLIQFMRGGKYAVETAIPEQGEPLLDIDSGTLYYGNGKDLRGNPINTGSALRLEGPVDLDKQVTWGKYYIEGKLINQPELVEVYGKFFLIVEGSEATDAFSVYQTLHVLTGANQDKSFVRSSTDRCESWTSWKSDSGSSMYFDPNGSGTKDKNPAAPVNEYVLPSQNYIESISGGPQGTDGCPGFLTVYRKDDTSPFIYQELVVLGDDDTPGETYCRLSVNENRDWNEPGYNWRSTNTVPASTTEAGIVKLSNAVTSSSEKDAATPKAVKTAYDLASRAISTKYSMYMQDDPETVPPGLADGGLVFVVE